MNFKEIKLKFRMGILTLRNRFGEMKSSLTIKSGSGQAESILIFLPLNDNACRIAAYSFRSLHQLEKRGVEYKICVLGNHIPNVDGVLNNLESYKLDENNRKVLLPESVTKRRKFDMILDLNPELNLEISECIAKIPADYKVGFQSKLADAFYNIQIDRDQSVFLEYDYGRIKTILNLP